MSTYSHINIISIDNFRYIDYIINISIIIIANILHAVSSKQLN